ncbi:hypothetical protein LP52_09665 [Streptomonospora alba]|uniref:N-acetyltransferase domain-containing protein n=1 Tax=Streptomonospora alba TaxID=183763 RepID=A0A0C2JCG0_9ACTN|nr:GNAT family N-acetyltransferase [Streptomonospora alba]KIH99101.1 hypothetical protein LP52_09665 [Streptomonospora alba]
MIRERREEDLDRLCAVLESMDRPSGIPEDLSGWLEEYDAELSWVFDMAPVRVAPTKNVVAHVQVYGPADGPATARMAECTGRPPGELLAIGKHFVKPGTYEWNIGRYLLRESVTYIRSRGRIPVLDLHRDGFLSKEFYEKFGFHEADSGDPGVTPMVYTG